MKTLWCEINTNILLSNLNKVKDIVGDKKIISVLKSNAYGLGISELSSKIDSLIDMYAVNTYDEYLSINSSKDVLIMAPTCSKKDFEHANENLVLTIDSLDLLNSLDKNTIARVHLFIDTNNHRMGIPVKDVSVIIDKIDKEYKNIKIEGLYTHFHECNNVDKTLCQIKSFEALSSQYSNRNFLIHCLSSSSIVNPKLFYACSFTNSCRVGNLIYGFGPASLGFEKCFNYYANIIHKEKVSKGDFIGFGSSYNKAPKDMLIGVIGVGSYHGLGVQRSVCGISLNFAKRLYRLICPPNIAVYNNRAIKVVGQVNMNTTILDLTENPEINCVQVNLSPVLSDSSIPKKYI